MQRSLWLVPTMVLLLAIVTPAASAAGVTYYLHAAGECADPGPTLYLDTQDTEGDADGCGAVGTAGAVGGFTVEYPGNDTFEFDASDAEATFHVYIATASPDNSVSVAGAFTSGKASCRGASPTTTVTSVYGAPTYTDIKFDCTFSGKADPGKKPSVGLTITAATSYFLGYDGTHASNVQLRGLAANETASGTDASSPGASPGSKSPGLGTLDVLVVGIALVALVRLRRG